MSKFYVPTRYDVNDATAGKWFDIVDEAGNNYGEFKLKLLDPSSQRNQADINRLKIKYRAKSKTMSEEDSATAVLCELALVDWKLPTDPADKDAEAVPYSVADGMEYFNLNDFTRWVRSELFRIATDITYFAPEMAEVAEEVEKN